MNVGTNATAPSGFQTVLSQVFPWKESDTILVTDSVACDGRFVAYAVVSAALTETSRSSPNSKDACVLWLGCTSLLESSILASLKKIGCDKTVLASAFISDQRAVSTSSITEQFATLQEIPQLTVSSIPSFLQHHLVQSSGKFNAETLMKELVQLVQAWIKAQDRKSTGPLLVIVDDVSALASLVGKRLAYHLILVLQSWKSREEACSVGILIRCANDYDLELVGLTSSSTPDSDWMNKDQRDSDGQKLHRSVDVIPWERALVELADTIVDVTPLSNGYSREVHGRLLFRVQSPEAASYTYNFCLTDSQVFVMRVASQPHAGR